MSTGADEDEERDDLHVATYELPAGQYRVVTRKGGLVLKEVHLTPDMRETTLDIDLRNAAWIAPIVTVPSDYQNPGGPIKYTVVQSGRWFRANTRLLHPGDRELTLVASAPLLMPDPERGTISISRGGPVELRTVYAPVVRLRWLHETRSRTIDVELFRDGRAVGKWRSAYRRGANYEFLAPPPGVYDMVVRSPRLAPAILKNVKLLGDLDGETDVVGSLRTTEGCELRVNLVNPPLATRISVRATLVDPPVWLPVENSTRAPGPAGWSILNVPRGRVRIKVTVGDQTLVSTWKSDGVTDKIVVIDCEG